MVDQQIQQCGHELTKHRRAVLDRVAVQTAVECRGSVNQLASKQVDPLQKLFQDEQPATTNCTPDEPERPWDGRIGSRPIALCGASTIVGVRERLWNWLSWKSGNCFERVRYGKTTLLQLCNGAIPGRTHGPVEAKVIAIAPRSAAFHATMLFPFDAKIVSRNGATFLGEGEYLRNRSQ